MLAWQASEGEGRRKDERVKRGSIDRAKTPRPVTQATGMHETCFLILPWRANHVSSIIVRRIRDLKPEVALMDT